METERGRIAVGWLIVEDLAMVLALVLLPALAGVLGGNSDALASDPLAARSGWALAACCCSPLRRSPSSSASC